MTSELMTLLRLQDAVRQDVEKQAKRKKRLKSSSLRASVASKESVVPGMQRETEKWIESLATSAALLLVDELPALLAADGGYGLNPEGAAERRAARIIEVVARFSSRVAADAHRTFWFKSKLPSLLAAQARKRAGGKAASVPRASRTPLYRKKIESMYAGGASPSKEEVVAQLEADGTIEASDDGEWLAKKSDDGLCNVPLKRTTLEQAISTIKKKSEKF
ncbi:hypothetical protein [Rhodocyclus tenuis]|uniref:Uncharacterized protein n=1 Tax=Rhodocyclus tenuis TaxID=1066 RepID=A0A840G3N9_RHOTE|nr:hypothetical protein [Rhodocyclus tenuis]MBB4249034.1 hypothetical protein [Rhodocyclus tenuis]